MPDDTARNTCPCPARMSTTEREESAARACVSGQALCAQQARGESAFARPCTQKKATAEWLQNATFILEGYFSRHTDELACLRSALDHLYMQSRTHVLFAAGLFSTTECTAPGAVTKERTVVASG